MAAVEQSEKPADQVELKYLDFFRVAVIQATSYVVTVYERAKDSSGPLKPGVDSVEGTVKTVVGPVIQQFHSKPTELLQFVDKQVDFTINFLDGVVPQSVKDKSQIVYTDVKQQGLYGTAKSYYCKIEPVAEQWSYDTWQTVRMLPLVPRVVDAVAPPALYGADKLNHVVLALKERHLPLSSYIPLLPVEKLERALRSGTQ